MASETLGHFEILDKLGEGGMGVLYRARDSRLGRTVAIKLLRPEVVALRAVSAQRGACTVAVVGWGDGRRFQPSVRGSADRQL